MHWDGRFAIGVTLIWVMLVSGTFYLLTGMLTPAVHHTAPDSQLEREWNRKNRVPPAPMAVSSCVRVRTSP